MSSSEDLQAWFRQYRQLPLLLEQERWSEALVLIDGLQQTLPVIPGGPLWSGLGPALRESVVAQADLAWHYDPRPSLAAWEAQCLFQQGHKAEAIEVLRAACAQGPPQAALLHQLSRYLLVLGDTNQAIMALHQAVQTEPTYLSAFEDLAFLANEAQAPATAWRLAQLGLKQGFSVRLLEESLLAALSLDQVVFQQSFLELCVQAITPSSLPLLLALGKQLYQQQDFLACEYLSWHLLAEQPAQREVLELYVRAALQLRHYVPLLRLLKTRLQQEPEHPHGWEMLACVYADWEMPQFARQALLRASQLTGPAELSEQAGSLLNSLVPDPSPDHELHVLIKAALIDPSFLAQLRAEPEATLIALEMQGGESLVERLQPFLNGMYNEPSSETGS